MLENMTRTRDLPAATTDRGSTPLGTVVELFRIFNQAEGKSKRTVSWYDERLLWLLREFGEDHPIAEFTEEKLRLHIAGYLKNAKNGEPLKPSTMNNHGRALRAFFHWAYREGYTRERLLGRFRPHRIPFQLIEPLSDREIEAVLAAARFKRRDNAIVSLLLDTGLRAFELCGLRASDVNLDEDWVKVLGKGAKERIVPFGKRARKTLLTYVLNERPDGVSSEFLFLGHDGKCMTPDGVRQIMDRLKRRSGVTRLHAHLLRHTFATRFLLAGGSALLLKQLLGHTTLAMVDRYVHLSNMRAVEVSRAFSPLDRLGAGAAPERAMPAPAPPSGPSIREAWLRHRA
jgi:integrase/recombinase XerC/integrase/recombinase XerD